MNRTLRTWLCAAPALGLAACATTAPRYTIDGLALLNRTGVVVHEVRLAVPATGGVVACGQILEQAGCATTFPAREYQGNPVTVSWMQGGRSYRQAAVVFELAPGVVAGEPLTALVELARGGGVRARLVPAPR
jgi:hypothetical protein